MRDREREGERGRGLNDVKGSPGAMTSLSEGDMISISSVLFMDDRGVCVCVFEP